MTFCLFQAHSFLPHIHHDEITAHHHDSDYPGNSDHHDLPLDAGHSTDFGKLALSLKNIRIEAPELPSDANNWHNELIIDFLVEALPVVYNAAYDTYLYPAGLYKATPLRAPPAHC